MSGLFGKSEKVNNILFVGILILFALSLFLLSGIFALGDLLNVRFESDVILLFNSLSVFLTIFLWLFSSIIFGYVSKSPKKAFLLGFLIWASLPLFSVVKGILGSVTPIYGSILILFFINGIITGSAGYFAAVDSPDKNKRTQYRLISLALFLVSIGLFLAIALIGFSQAF
jgi:hypothetical protein